MKMAASDVEKVILRLNAKTRIVRNHTGFRTPDGILVIIKALEHVDGWSRGFTVSSGLHHTKSAYDAEGRYTGRGWHARMAEDILKHFHEHRHHRPTIYCGRCQPAPRHDA